MLVYFIFIYLPFYLSFILRYFTKNNLYIIPAILVTLVFSSSRYMIGWDYIHYYDALTTDIENNITLRGGYLTKLIIDLSKHSNAPFFYFFLNSSILFFFIVRFSFKYSSSVWLSYVIFIGFPLFYLNSLSVIRSFTAVAIVLLALEYLANRRLFIFLFVVFIASLFHQSALFALIFPIFLYFKPSAFLWLSLYFISIFFKDYILFLIIPGISLLAPEFSLYIEPSLVKEGTRAIYVLLIFAFSLILFKIKWSNKDFSFHLFSNIYLLGVLIYYLFIEYGTLGHRLTLYSTILIIILLPIIVNKLKNSSLIFASHALIHVTFIIFFMMTLFVGSETYLPYKFLFNL